MADLEYLSSFRILSLLPVVFSWASSILFTEETVSSLEFNTYIFFTRLTHTLSKFQACYLNNKHRPMVSITHVKSLQTDSWGLLLRWGHFTWNSNSKILRNERVYKNEKTSRFQSKIELQKESASMISEGTLKKTTQIGKLLPRYVPLTDKWIFHLDSDIYSWPKSVFKSTSF